MPDTTRCPRAILPVQSEVSRLPVRIQRAATMANTSSGIVETAVFPWLNRGRPGSTESYDGWRHSAGTQHPGADPPGK